MTIIVSSMSNNVSSNVFIKVLNFQNYIDSNSNEKRFLKRIVITICNSILLEVHLNLLCVGKGGHIGTWPTLGISIFRQYFEAKKQ